MGRKLEVGCLGAGAVLVVAGIAVVFWPAALVTAGVLLIGAGWPRGRAA